MLKFRYLRRRLILLLIVLGSLLYILFDKLSKRTSLVSDDYEIKHTLLRQPFEWQPKIPDHPIGDSNSTKRQICRNSVQGRDIITDERGYTCNRSSLDTGGCCDVKTASTSRHSCDTCAENACCVVFEFCVSCCLKPDKTPLLQKILREARENLDISLGSVTDHFQLCLAKCRTSSSSVQHENSYRNSKAKYCYGENSPELQPLTA